MLTQREGAVIRESIREIREWKGGEGVALSLEALLKRVKRNSVKRIRSKPRRGPRRDAKYKNWLTSRHCVLDPCFTARDTDPSKCECSGRIDPAHTLRNGTSSKGPDSSCVPLCRKHHEEFDAARNAAGRAAFDKRHGVSMVKLSETYYANYLRETGREAT